MNIAQGLFNHSSLIGETLQNRYQIVEQLGAGAQGETYLAVDSQRFNSHCVVKRLITIDSDRFQTEAKILQSLGDHPENLGYVPKLFAYFQENNLFYIVQDFINGQTLDKFLINGKKYTEVEVITLLNKILLPVEFVHKNNIIHRDIKPENIMMTVDKLVLIDFGVIKELNQQSLHGNSWAGTPGYMPAIHEYIKPRLNIDIYAVGMIGLQALSGQNPYNFGSAIAKIININPPDFTPQNLEDIIKENNLNLSPRFCQILGGMIHPDCEQRWANAGEVLEMLKNIHNQQITIQQSWVNINNNQPTLSAEEYLDLGLSKIKADDYKGAITDLDQAIKINPNQTINVDDETLNAYFLRGLAKIQLKDYQGAIADIDQGMKIDPNNTNAYNLRGIIKLELKDYYSAIADFSQAIKRDSKNINAYGNRGIAKYELKDYHGAKSDFNQCQKINSKNSDVYCSLGDCERQLKDYDTALYYYNKALEINDKNSDSYSGRGITFYELKEYEKAITDLNQAIDLDPEDVENYIYRGLTKSELKDYYGAIVDFSHAIYLDPNNADAYNYRGNIYEILQDTKQAQIDKEKAEELSKQQGKT
jgi:serine/threonine protein kinase